MYTIVFQGRKKAYRYSYYAPDSDSLLDWLYDMAAKYKRIVYLLIVDSNKQILLKYKRPAR